MGEGRTEMGRVAMRQGEQAWERVGLLEEASTLSSLPSWAHGAIPTCSCNLTGEDLSSWSLERPELYMR